MTPKTTHRPPCLLHFLHLLHLLTSWPLVAGCVPEPGAGTETATAATSTTTSADTLSGTSTSEGPATEPSTGDVSGETTGVKEPLCGDGILDPGEPCDDGNEVEDDGCTSSCAPTPVIKWTQSLDGSRGLDDVGAAVAVDASGRVIVAGRTQVAGNDVDELVMAFTPDGALLWQARFDGGAGDTDFLASVAVDGSGAIYVGGGEHPSADVWTAVIHKLSPAGELVWTFSDPNPSGNFTSVGALTLAGDALVGVGAEELDLFVHCPVRRIDTATGALLWETNISAGGTFTSCLGVAELGASILAVGLARDAEDALRGLQVRVAVADGATQALTLDDDADHAWYGVAPFPDGERVLVGRIDGATSSDMVLRRLDAAGVEAWTVELGSPKLDESARGVVALADGGVIVAGDAGVSGQLANAVVLRVNADGEQLWLSTYNNPEASLDDVAYGIARGPGCVAVTGFETVLGEGRNVWVRAFGLP